MTSERRSRGRDETEAKQRRELSAGRERSRTSAERRAETRDQIRDETDQRRDQRREQREQSASRDENRLQTETQSESENTRNDSLKLELVRRALLCRKSATTVVVLHVESDLHEHANGCRKSAHLAHLAPLTRATHASDCIKGARVTTPPTVPKIVYCVFRM